MILLDFIRTYMWSAHLTWNISKCVCSAWHQNLESSYQLTRMSGGLGEVLCHDNMDTLHICIQTGDLDWGLNHSLFESWQNAKWSFQDRRGQEDSDMNFKAISHVPPSSLENNNKIIFHHLPDSGKVCSVQSHSLKNTPTIYKTP